MQVDHIKPQRIFVYKTVADCIENLNPSCRRCNHYKRAHSIETFRELLLKLHKKIAEQYLNKVAEDYEIIKIEPWDGKFYFERVSV
jgi:5-methylcytosine-specific restriction endonuclease McrA